MSLCGGNTRQIIITMQKAPLDVKEVANRVYRLEAPIPVVNSVFAVYLIIQESEGVLIEPCPALAVPSIQ